MVYVYIPSIYIHILYIYIYIYTIWYHIPYFYEYIYIYTNEFPNNIKIIIRQVEKPERKHIKANMAILFNIYLYNKKLLLIFTSQSYYQKSWSVDHFYETKI